MAEYAEYKVEFADSAAKEFRVLPIDIKYRLRSSVDSLCQNPYPSGVRKLHGHKRLSRIRVGQYRILLSSFSIIAFGEFIS